jgi:hypothetical protein
MTDFNGCGNAPQKPDHRKVARQCRRVETEHAAVRGRGTQVSGKHPAAFPLAFRP